MKPFDEVLMKYFWAALLAVTIVNGIWIRRRANEAVERKPQLAAARDALVRGWFVWMNLPWVVMGIGCTLGGVSTFFHYFRPRDGNPFVIAWWVSIFVLQLVCIYWAFFRKGADILAECTSTKKCSSSPFEYLSASSGTKLFLVLGLVATIIMLVVMLVTDIPIPTFASE